MNIILLFFWFDWLWLPALRDAPETQSARRVSSEEYLLWPSDSLASSSPLSCPCNSLSTCSSPSLLYPSHSSLLIAPPFPLSSLCLVRLPCRTGVRVNGSIAWAHHRACSCSWRSTRVSVRHLIIRVLHRLTTLAPREMVSLSPAVKHSLDVCVCACVFCMCVFVWVDGTSVSSSPLPAPLLFYLTLFICPVTPPPPPLSSLPDHFLSLPYLLHR